MLQHARGYFGTRVFAHVGIVVLSVAIQGSFLNNWISSHAVVYWGIDAVLMIGYLVISAQESINQAGRDAQIQQGCIDRGEGEAEQSAAYQPWYGLRNAAILELPFMILTVISGFAGGMTSVITGIFPNLWYAAYQPVRDLWPAGYPWMYLIFGAVAVLVGAVVYPEGKRRFLLMREHMLENTERLRRNEAKVRIPRGK